MLRASVILMSSRKFLLRARASGRIQPQHAMHSEITAVGGHGKIGRTIDAQGFGSGSTSYVLIHSALK